jgi:hypothetical protein
MKTTTDVRRERFTRETALAFFDALPAVTIEACIGRWKGASVGTEHPLDGLLEKYGWYGKEFLDPDQPIVDVFRKVDDATLLGLMDLRGMEAPFFFLLEREL